MDRITRIIESANDIRPDGEESSPTSGLRDPAINWRRETRATQSFDLGRILEKIPDARDVAPKSDGMRKLEAITKVLSVYGVLDQLSPTEQDNLLGSILGILEAEHLG